MITRAKEAVTWLAIAVAATSIVGCAREPERETVEPSAPNDPATAESERPPPRGWEVPQSAPGGAPYPDELRARIAAALDAKPREYQPRTHHVRPDGSPLYSNRLALESSPYLLQHAHNPVDWYPWGDEAFRTAERLGRPVLLSVGYSTCHWCHVMERESFEDLEVAAFINANFVAVKVDREERPDVDAVYMRVLQLLTGGGGWPMTILLTPDRRPIFAGTYFPARDGDRAGAPGLMTVLTTVSERFAENPEAIAAEAQRLTKRLQASATPPPASGIPGAPPLKKAVAELSGSFDTLYGGFGPPPKFPRSVAIEMLLRYHRRTKDESALHMAAYTLERMAAGGMRDQLGGGFHRYSTDARWRVPHFEKMLYDNALLAMAYLDGYQAAARDDLREVAAETLDYVAREMTDVSGGFYSATDAESLGPDGVAEEGRFFTWTAKELRELLAPAAAELVINFYGVTEDGNFPNGRNVLYVASNLDVVARKSGLTKEAAARRLDAARSTLRAARARRSPPGKDTKVIAAWNGLMVSAFARAALVIGDPAYAEQAVRAATFLAREMRDDEGRLARVWKDGIARETGVLDDYAFVIAGMLDLFEASGELRWLDLAVSLQRRLDEDFADPEGGYFLTAADAERLLVRLKPDYDGALPSGNSVAVMNLLRLSDLTGREQYRKSAEGILKAFSGLVAKHPSSVPSLLCALDRYLDRPKEIAILVPDYEKGPARFLTRMATMFLPNRALVVAEAGEPASRLAERVPLLEDKALIDDVTTAYVCENRVCKKPTTDPNEFVTQLAPVAPYP